MIPVEDIEIVIKTLKGKLPKINNSRDPNTYYAGREYGERSAYSDAIHLLMSITKQYKNVE